MRAMLSSLIAALLLGGCASPNPSRSPYSRSDEVVRDTQRARELHAEATRAMQDDPEKAEALLREALAADLYHGPAHNNLGVLLLQRGRLYEAVGEFEWARKLMPGHPDPRVNLALALEEAGRVDEALDAYDAALAVFDGYLPALQGRTRLQIERREADSATIAALSEIALRGDEQWRSWALMWETKLADPTTTLTP